MLKIPMEFRQFPDHGFELVQLGFANADTAVRFLLERRFDPPPTLAPGETIDLEMGVACAEPPGTVVENAFLILRAFWKGREWRVLARMLVTIGGHGAPTVVTEVVTTQPVGFSGADV